MCGREIDKKTLANYAQKERQYSAYCFSMRTVLQASRTRRVVRRLGRRQMWRLVFDCFRNTTTSTSFAFPFYAYFASSSPSFSRGITATCLSAKTLLVQFLPVIVRIVDRDLSSCNNTARDDNHSLNSEPKKSLELAIGTTRMVDESREIPWDIEMS